MENLIGEIIKSLIIVYIIYVFLLTFMVTTFSYLTYRFWKMILSKEELNIFISNAPVIGHNYNEENNKKSTNFNRENI